MVINHRSARSRTSVAPASSLPAHHHQPWYVVIRPVAPPRHTLTPIRRLGVVDQVSGWDGVPAAGDILTVVENEVVARQAAEARRKLARERTGTCSHACRTQPAVRQAGSAIDTELTRKGCGVGGVAAAAGVEMSRSMQAQVLSLFGADGSANKERKELTVVIKVSSNAPSCLSTCLWPM